MAKLQRDPTTHKILREPTSHKLIRAATGDPCCCGGGGFSDCREFGIRCAKVTIADSVLCTDYTDVINDKLIRQITGDINDSYLIPVCGTTFEDKCLFARSFCNKATYAFLGPFSAYYQYASVLYFKIEMSVSAFTFDIGMRPFKHGCCNLFDVTSVPCWVPNPIDGDPTPPTPPQVKSCPCPGDPTQIFCGSAFGFKPTIPMRSGGSTPSFDSGPGVISVLQRRRSGEMVARDQLAPLGRRTPTAFDSQRRRRTLRSARHDDPAVPSGAGESRSR
jgi:hypothetical protein